jgi:hypothetical protein
MSTEQESQQPGWTVTQNDTGLVVTGPLDPENRTNWSVVPLDDKRIMLVSEEGKVGKSSPTGLASCPIEVFKDFLLGLSRAGWSGVVVVDTGYGQKRVFLSRGDIVFAASNVIDDRLGEVIYREGRISIDELTNSAAQVTKARKFGQVLISSGIFSNVQLWAALKLQVKQILRSIFMVDRVYFELQEGMGLAPTEVIFQESVTDLVGDCYSYGCAFRAFLGRLRAESQIVLTQSKDKIQKEFEPGTFIGDLMGMIEQQSNVQELLNMSKLLDSYTISALSNLVNMGLCKISPEIDDKRKTSPEMAPLKAKFDAYAYVLQSVKKAFAEGGKEFPVADVKAFAASLNPEGFPSIFLDTQGSVDKDSVNGIMSQCIANPERVSYFTVRIESLIQFLLQVAGDNLQFQTASRIRQDYRSVSA